jgi:aspartyl-tRNA(Asn)/glutamyl-tRNA(Gln) amidotransferase subunit A
VSIKSIKKALPAYYTLATAEAASNLARYDGLRYGHNTDIEVESGASELLFKNRSSHFLEEVGQRIILGNYTLSSDSGDHYLRATELREELCREFSSAFKNPHVLLQDQQNDSGVDLIMGTTALSSAPSMREYLEQTEKNMINEYANDVLTVPASLAGIPAASVQFKGIGIQLMGQFGDDELVLDVAKELSK